MKTLLLLLSHYPYDEKNRERLAALLGDVTNWTEVVNLINSHGIIALAACNIKEAHLENLVPEEDMLFLENGLRQNIVRNLWLTERWKEVNSILTAAGIKHILLKGMALEHTLYGSRGLRQMTDNDILINPADAMRAWLILQKNGFTIQPLKSSLYKKILLKSHKHLPTLLQEDYALEIHTNIFPDNKEISDTELFNNPPVINIDGVPANILPANLQLKYLISHFERHLSEGECQVRSYADIILLDGSLNIEFPDEFIFTPSRSIEPHYRRIAYRSAVRSVPYEYRLRYLIGDLFPSLQWMKQRYHCGTFGAVLHYPHRLGKLGWLV